MFIKIENLGKKYGDEYVFSNMTSMITDSHKVGIIGKNGSGKTTFLKILAGELRAERGSIEIDPKGAKVVYHTQVINETIELIDDIADITCFTYLMSQNKELLKYWLKLNSENPELDYSELITEYSELNGYDFEDKIIKACKKLKLNPEDKVVNLSGGQKTRLQLAKLLIEDHDILLLDEPTNHLDIDGLEWFYEYIKKYKGIVIIASHDRNLLSKSVNKIVEFEKGKVTEYTGNYEAYRAKKQELRIAKENRIRANEKKVSQLNETAKKLEERVARHVKKAEELEVANFRAARLLKKNKRAKTKIINRKLNLYRDNDKMTTNFKLDRQEKKFDAARGNILSRANKLKPERSKIGWDMKLEFNTEPIQSDFVVRIKDLSKSFDKKDILTDFNLELMKNQKIAITGPNGTGKSTILKCITGEIKDYSGFISISDSVKIGYLEQENSGLNPEARIIDEFQSSAKNLSHSEARSFLHFFLFEGDMPLRRVETLSEGEKLKLKLAKLLYSKANVLLLDEPTNHLDISSQEVIEKALNDFEGSIILVTHDEMLMKGIGVSKRVQLFRN